MAEDVLDISDLTPVAESDILDESDFEAIEPFDGAERADELWTVDAGEFAMMALEAMRPVSAPILFYVCMIGPREIRETGH